MKVQILEEQIKRTFFRDLPDTFKNNFLQLEATYPYTTGPLNDLCIKIIKRHEKLMVSLSPVVESENFVRANTAGQEEKVTDTCFYCDMPGQKKSDCRSRKKDQTKVFF